MDVTGGDRWSLYWMIVDKIIFYGIVPDKTKAVSIFLIRKAAGSSRPLGLVEGVLKIQMHVTTSRIGKS